MRKSLNTCIAVMIGATSAAFAGTAEAEPTPAQPETAPQSRVFAGLSAYDTTYLDEYASFEIDGARMEPDGSGGFGVVGGYSHVLKPQWLLLLGVLRYTTLGTSWSDAAGEARRRVDLAIGPQVYFPIKKNGRVSLYFALPAGGSIVWIEPGNRRAIAESYDTGYGFNYGATAGVAWRPAPTKLRALGLIAEGSLLMHHYSIKHRVETLTPPIRSLEETYRYRSPGILVSVGAEFWL